MTGWRIRLRPLLVLLVVVLLGSALALANAATSRSLRTVLASEVPAARVAAIAEQFGQNALLFGVIALGVGAAAAFAIGTLLVHPLARLRTGVTGLTRAERDSATIRPPIVEYQALAAAVDRAATELAQHLTELSAERDAMATLVNVVSEGILQVGADGRVIQANPAARRLLGIPEDAVGQPLRALIRQAEVRGLLDRAMEGHIGGATEVALDERRLLVSARPISASPASENGDGNATVITFTDLTEVRRLEGVRRDFVANVSHELKTPLTSIRGYVETLMTDELPEDMKRQFLEVIQKNAERLQGIVDDLLDLSRLESGGWRPEMQVVDPLRFAEETWSTTSSTGAARKRIEFLPIGEAGPILADPRGLRQVLTNLYDNALRHTPEGGRITVRVGRDPTLNSYTNGHPPDASWVSIDVHDTGSGIPSDALPRIFERFYRVDPARSRAEGGTGLGLSIVKHLME
ncbi:MAG: sensor histidine kinase, partial [Longimicrobiales bacterium]